MNQRIKQKDPPYQCPVCDSDRTSCMDTSWGGNLVFAYWNCLRCKTEWTETYIFLDYEITYQGSE